MNSIIEVFLAALFFSIPFIWLYIETKSQRSFYRITFGIIFAVYAGFIGYTVRSIFSGVDAFYEPNFLRASIYDIGVIIRSNNEESINEIEQEIAIYKNKVTNTRNSTTQTTADFQGKIQAIKEKDENSLSHKKSGDSL